MDSAIQCLNNRGLTILGVLKSLGNEGTSLALQVARPSRHSDYYTKMAVLSLLGDVKILSPISTFMLRWLNTVLRAVSGISRDRACF